MLPAMLQLRRVRGDLTVRTPLNTIEKLMAPSSAAVVLGAQVGPVLGTAVEVIQSLGHPRGMAVQGLEGSINPSVRKRSRGIEIDGSHLVPVTVEPQDFGLEGSEEPELPMFGPPEEGYGTADNPALAKACGDVTRAVLSGETGPARNACLLGAALILKACGRCMTIAEGVDAASRALDDGAATERLEHLRSLMP